MRVLALGLAVLCAAPDARGDDCTPLALGYLGSPAHDARRLAQLRGEAGPSLLLLRPSDAPRASCAAPAAGAAPLEARAVLLGGYPDDRNDGLLWAGRGVSGSLTLGVTASWRFLSAGVVPAVAWSQNRDYPRRLGTTPPGVSPYAHPFLAPGIDLPARMGGGAAWAVDAGQSFVRADVGGLAFGLSNENLWWGPGVRDALVFGGSGPGFPHAFVGTGEPVDVWIGWLEAQLVLGRLSTSRYLAADGRVGHTVLRAAAVAFEPRFARGFYLGFAHAFVGRETGTIAGSALEHLVGRGAGAPDGGQNTLSSLSARWVLPAARLELYGEWGRDDTAALLDLAMEPERSSAYAFGLQKLVDLGRRRLRLQVEAADTFEVPAVNAPLGTPVFYTHDQGTFYSHRGQALGAGLGPAAQAQLVAVDLLRGPSRLGLYAERRLRHLRAFYDSYARPKGRDLELGGGVRALVARGPLALEWQAGLARRWNLEFVTNAWQPRFHVTLGLRAP